jgi:hypothetical protein
VQVVGYESAVEGPAALRVAADGELSRVPLAPGADLDFSLGARHCAGVVEDGRHTPCDDPAAPRCPVHTSTWACARCTGDCDKALPACDEEHAVYLAAFAPDAFKVGVTRSWRLEERLREQGADRAAHVRTVEDGRRARRVEAGIAETVGDSVRVATKVSGLHREVDADAWAALLSEFDVLERFAFDRGLDLESQPVSATLARGTVRGVVGRVLVLDSAGTTYAVDLRELVGHEVVEGGPATRRQASLGAFE